MDTELAQLQRNIARIRREIQIQSREMQALIETDIDCTNAARLLMRMQADLVLFVEKRERLKSPFHMFDCQCGNRTWISEKA